MHRVTVELNDEVFGRLKGLQGAMGRSLAKLAPACKVIGEDRVAESSVVEALVMAADPVWWTEHYADGVPERGD